MGDVRNHGPRYDRLALATELARRNMTSADLARKSGLHQNTVWRLLRGEVGLRTLAKACVALDLDLHEICRRKSA